MEYDLAHRITHRNLPQLFLKARESLMSHFRPILKHFGLTEQQWRILRALVEHAPLEPREICNLCQILSPSMAGILARMEEMELIERSRMAADQRRVLVRLTQKGGELIGAMAPLIELQYKHIEQAFGRQVFDQLSSVLEGVIGAEGDRVQHVELPAKVPAGMRAPATQEPKNRNPAISATIRNAAGKK